jgi:hypothetical protein
MTATRRLALLASAWLAVSARADLFCVAEDGVFHYRRNCVERAWDDRRVEPSDVERKFVWARKQQHALAIGVIPPRATSVDIQVGAAIGGSDWLSGPEDADGTVVLTETKLGTWTITLDPWWFREGRLQFDVPAPGEYAYTVTVAGKQLINAKGLKFAGRTRPGPRDTRPAATIAGRAIGAGSGTPADFANITADCRNVVCETRADGTFNCPLTRPLPSTLCIEHPRLGRKWIELQGRSGEVDLGTIELLRGGTIRVTKPLHVELPEGTTMQLLRKRATAGKPVPLGSREVYEFNGLEADRYQLLLAGPQPLQRKLFPVHVTEGETELALSVDPFKLTGEVVHRDKAFGGATVVLDGPAWNAELKTDQSGRFEAELWAAESYGVLVSGPGIDEPYGVMKRVSSADNEWRLVVPSRKLHGRVTDRGTGKPVSDALIVTSSDSENTRRSRNVRVRDDGTFEIPGVAAGSYLIAVRAPGYLSSEESEIRIAEKDGDVRFDATLERGTEVRAVVTSAGTGKPLAHAVIVSDFSADGSIAGRTTITRDDGTALVTVPENGSALIAVLPKSGSFALVRVSAADAVNGISIAVPEPVAVLTLNTVMATGEPLPGVGIRLRRDGQDVPSAALTAFAAMHQISLVTKESGRTSIPLLPAGKYDVSWVVRSRPIRGAKPVSVELADQETVVTQTFSSAG